MSIRSFEELKSVLSDATRANNTVVMNDCALELEAIGTKESRALAASARASIESHKARPTAALNHYQQALELYEELADRTGMARVTGNMGVLLLNTASYPEALTLLNRSMELYEEIGDRSGVARATNNIGLVYNSTGVYSKTLEYLHRALFIQEELGDVRSTSATHLNIGYTLSNLGNYPLALEHFNKAIDIDTEHGNTVGIAQATNGLGLVYLATGNYPLALEHLNGALALYESIGNRISAALVLSNIGNLYDLTGNVDKALEKDHEALVILEESEDRSAAANLIGNMGVIYWRTGDYSQAMDHFQRALAIKTELGENSVVSHLTGNIVKLLIDSGSMDEAEALLVKLDAMETNKIETILRREQSRASIQEHYGHFDEAMITLEASCVLAKEHSLQPPLAVSHKQMRDLAIKRNDLAAYVHHNTEFTRITEEINGKDTAAKLAIQEAERKMAKERSEHEKHLAVLHSTLPKHIADRVARGEQVNDHFDNAVVIFLDIVGFTTLSDQLSSEQVVQLLDTVFTSLDAVCKKHDVVKIKTIGDSYMAVAFEEQPNNRITEQPISSCQERAASAAIDMLQAVSHIVSPVSSPNGSPEGSPVRVRIGIHSGTLTAGVIGTERMQYDVWGDTVNVASRMESTGEPGRIHVSEAFATFLGLRPRNDSSPLDSSNEEPGTWHLARRGEIEIKGKGTMRTYWLESPLP